MILAATSAPEASHLLQFWLILSLTATTLAAIATAVNVFSNRKQRREVSFSFEPASKVEFERHLAANKTDHDQLFSKLGGVERGAATRIESGLTALRTERQSDMDALRHERREDIRTLHVEINEVGKKVASLETAVTMTNQSLAGFGAKLDRFTERAHR